VDTLVGTSLGGYTLKRLLGNGGMGAVYLATDPAIGQQVAIKVVRTDADDYPDLASAIRAAERFKQEARAIASLDHLHILPLYRYGEEQTDNGQRAYMVMQYRPEGSLWDWIRKRASQPLSGSPVISSTRLPGQDSLAAARTWPFSIEDTAIQSQASTGRPAVFNWYQVPAMARHVSGWLTIKLPLLPTQVTLQRSWL
jgi:Protein kinase domain